jgi:hypothetical protein
MYLFLKEAINAQVFDQRTKASAVPGLHQSRATFVALTRLYSKTNKFIIPGKTPNAGN